MGAELLIPLRNSDVQLGRLVPVAKQDVLEHKRLSKAGTLGKQPMAYGIGSPGRTLPVRFAILGPCRKTSRDLL